MKTLLRWLGRAATTLVLLVVLALAGAFAWQRFSLEQEEGLRPPASQFVRVDGRLMHFACSGEGPRTYVLDAGAGAWSAHWWRIAPRLARSGRVCVFDRPGYGWSEPTTRGHDGLAAAGRLHAMVRAAGIGRPFVYVGHSLGANIGEVYRDHYPQDVSALVLLEPGDPTDLLEDVHGPRSKAMALPECALGCWLGRAAGELGVLRPLAHGKSFAGVRAQYVAGANRPSHLATAAMELAAAPRTAWQDRDVASFGDTPVLIFASSHPRQPDSKETPADVARWEVTQRAYLAGLAARSSRSGGLVIVPGSTHATMVLGEPQAAFVADRIVRFVEGPQPTSTR